MKKSTENTNDYNFLKDGLRDDISKRHNKYLGTNIPENYFSKSKMSILDKMKEESKKEGLAKKQLVFWLRPHFKYMAVASLALLLGVTIWIQNSANSNNSGDTHFEMLAFSDDVLINSLLVEDSEMDAFADATLFTEVLVKAELTEQEMDDLILNSLILEDSLLDDYMDEKLIDTIIL